MNLEPFANLLQAEKHGQIGKTLFMNMMPATAKTAILLRSPLTGTPLDHELPGYLKHEFQLIVRARSYTEGEAKIEAVTAALTMYERQVGDLYVKYVRPQTKPVAFPLSDGNLLEFSVQFSFCVVETP